MSGFTSLHGSLSSLKDLLQTTSHRPNVPTSASKTETVPRPSTTTPQSPLPVRPVVIDIAFHHGGYGFAQSKHSPVIFSLKRSPQYRGGVRVFVPWLFIYILSGAKTHDPSDFYFTLNFGGEPLHFINYDDILLEN